MRSLKHFQQGEDEVERRRSTSYQAVMIGTMDRKHKKDASQVDPGEPEKQPSPESEELTIRWLCYEEYPLSEPAEPDPESSE
jgi:hypothetical protein